MGRGRLSLSLSLSGYLLSIEDGQYSSGEILQEGSNV